MRRLSIMVVVSVVVVALAAAAAFAVDSRSPTPPQTRPSPRCTSTTWGCGSVQQERPGRLVAQARSLFVRRSTAFTMQECRRLAPGNSTPSTDLCAKSSSFYGTRDRKQLE